ncbi:MAG: DUF4139 domain-containing protein [Candidatus Acidiferrales bacterium]
MNVRPARGICRTALLLLAMLLLVAMLPRGGRADGTAKNSSAASVAISTQSDRTGLSLTVYNSNLALVREVRRIRVQPGVFVLRFEDVPSSINPASVQFRPLDDASKLTLLEQNYAYDQLDPEKLLRKYVGREVTLVKRERDAGSTKWVQTKAVLLADTNGQVWRIGNEIVTGAVADSYRFPDLPAGLYSTPTLLWTMENRGANEQSVEVTYLAGNMNWSAEYALTVARDEKSASLESWVTLTNNSGAAFDNARLQLVAGQIHQASQSRRIMPEMAFAAKPEAAAAPGFQQQAFSEYHLYTLSQRTSIANDESKQINLLAERNIPVQKYLEVDGQPYNYRNPQGLGNAIPEQVKVFYRFKNGADAGLGMPLPGGTVRVYQNDANGAAEFIGEDAIQHTPKGEIVRVNVGNAFDVVCERKEVDYKRLSNNSAEMEYQITLRNHQDTAVTVDVCEPVGGTWEVENSNYKWTKLDANTIGFEVPVDKNGSATLDYRVRVKW